MKIVFLDFDGVLNSWAFQHREIERDPRIQGGVVGIDRIAIARLNRLLKETGAYVVVSSTWRIDEDKNTVPTMQAFLVSYGFEGVVIGLTGRSRCGGVHGPKKLPCSEAHRGEEIREWLEFGALPREQLESPVKRSKNWRASTNFVILDDDSDMIPFMDRLIKTSMDDGLQDHHVDAAIAMLNGIKNACV